MTAVTVPFRLKPGDLQYAADTTHVAFVDRPLDDLDLSQLFMAVSGSPQPQQGTLRVGDQVVVKAFLDSDRKQLMEIGVCHIASKEGGVTAVWEPRGYDKDGKPILFFKVPQEAQKASTSAKERRLNVKKEFGGGFSVRDEKDHVIETFSTKKDANEYVERIYGKPDEAKAA
jgi:hypothetical protein